MTRIQPGITLPEDLWQKAKKQYGSRKTSQKIQELIENDLDEEIEKSENVLNLNGLSEKRKQLLLELIKRDNFPYSRVRIGKIARNEGIYTSKEYIKKAVEVLDKSNEAPITLDDGKINPDAVECGCGTRNTLSVLSKLDYKCPGCGSKIELGVN